MEDINLVARVRRQGLVALKRRVRALDSAQEKIERLVDRLVARKTKLPTMSDLQRVGELLLNLDDTHREVASYYATLVDYFGQATMSDNRTIELEL